MVEEPSPEEALTWLQGLRGRYERYHGVQFTDAALSTGKHGSAAGWRRVGQCVACHSGLGRYVLVPAGVHTCVPLGFASHLNVCHPLASPAVQR